MPHQCIRARLVSQAESSKRYYCPLAAVFEVAVRTSGTTVFKLAQHNKKCNVTKKCQ
jgi:hypothetical protein